MLLFVTYSWYNFRKQTEGVSLMLYTTFLEQTNNFRDLNNKYYEKGKICIFKMKLFIQNVVFSLKLKFQKKSIFWMKYI